MLNSDVLETATGLVFIYLLLSLVTTSARESLEALLKQRGKALEEGLIELFDAKGGEPAALLQRFYDHPLIYALYRGGYTPPKLDPKIIEAAKAKAQDVTTAAVQKASAVGQAVADAAGAAVKSHRKARWVSRGKLPSYIPSSSFALAVMDIAAGGGDSDIPLTVSQLSGSLDNLPDGKLKDVLRLALQTSQNDLAKTQKFLEDWYDSAMDRVSGAYKRHTQSIVFAFSVAACVALNVNSLMIAELLSQNQAMRQAVVAQAGEAAKAQPTNDAALDARIDRIGKTSLPIGWGPDAVKRLKAHLNYRRAANPASLLAPHADFGRWFAATLALAVGLLQIFAGWLVTAFAVTLGAPFWFDVLNKIVVIRSTVKPSEKSGDEASKDPSKPAQAAAPTSPPPPPAPPAPSSPTPEGAANAAPSVSQKMTPPPAARRRCCSASR